MDTSSQNEAPFGTYWVTLVNDRTGRVYKRHVIAETATKAASSMHAETGHSVLDVVEVTDTDAPVAAAVADTSRLDIPDEHPHPNMTVRRGHPLGTQLFVGGWRVGFYKTERGLQAAIARHAKAGA